MQNALAFIELTQTLAHACDEVDALLNILPRGVFRKFLNALNGCFFSRHSQTSFSLPSSTKLTYRSGDRWKHPQDAHLLTQRYSGRRPSTSDAPSRPAPGHLFTAQAPPRPPAGPSRARPACGPW